LILAQFLQSPCAFAQSELANVSGQVTDQSGAVIPDAELEIKNVETNLSFVTKTNGTGFYVFPSLKPGKYLMSVRKEMFRTVTVTDIVLNVQDNISRNFELQVGSSSESITVTADAGHVDMSPAVSTVVDQQFVQNMPLNGRSFQSLIDMTPGIVFATANSTQPGQFSVNGQRTNTNYFMVDGVSANISAGAMSTMGQTMGGTTPGWTIAGGTNGLVSVDAMQEFRIQTSTYAPEFGRSPGGQISVATRSGSNAFHGNTFDFLRNDVFDARNYFNTYPQWKPPLRQNDFGGTFGGPIVKDKTFFFFSYEGLRLRQPETYTASFYTAAARAKMAAVWLPFVNADPIPDGPVNANGFTAPITMSVSLPTTLDAYSMRVDHSLTNRINLFARVNYAPSTAVGGYQNENRTNNFTDITTMTGGATFTLNATQTNDFRANWSHVEAGDTQYAVNFYGGVIPAESVLYPSGFAQENTQLFTGTTGVGSSFGPRLGPFSNNVQRQLNFVDTFSWMKGKHQLKFGFDFRRMKPSPAFAPQSIQLIASYADLQAGTVTISPSTGGSNTVILNNYSMFAQDTFQVWSHLSLTYGVRWDVTSVPKSATDEPIYAVTGVFDSQPLALAPAGTPLWHTKLGNFAPRVGAAYEVTPKTVVRGGFGVFYDMGIPLSLASQVAIDFPWYRLTTSASSIPFNYSNSAIFQLPPFSLIPTGVSSVAVSAFDPNMNLPRVLEWNVAFERQLSQSQALIVSYVGSRGHNLIRQDSISPLGVTPPWSISAVRNGDWSRYDSLQAQFQRRLSRGLQTTLSYTLAKSTDTASNDSSNISARSLSQIDIGVNEGYSDFDVRHAFAGVASYELPSFGAGLIRAVTKGWALDGIENVHSGLPINITSNTSVIFNGVSQRIRPDVVPGQPFWIYTPATPGGRKLNSAAFTAAANNVPGDLTRNLLRNFGVSQTDLALRRRFDLSERVKLDLSVEYFNIFNHPMLALTGSNLLVGNGNFGVASVTQSVLIGGNSGQGGGVNPMYQMGGPRSGQFTLKISF